MVMLDDSFFGLTGNEQEHVGRAFLRAGQETIIE
jgi:hypothetical protein